MSKDNVLIEAKCAKTKKVFFLKLSKGADGVWVLLQGDKFAPQGEDTQGMSVGIEVQNVRVSPRYQCPHCGNKSLVECSCSNKITCWDGQSSKAYCAYCYQWIEVSGQIESLKGKASDGQ